MTKKEKKYGYDSDGNALEIDELLYTSIRDGTTGDLLKFCEADESKRYATRVVKYLNRVIGSMNPRYDPDYASIEQSEENIQLCNCQKQVIKMALGYCKRFDLDISLANNCVFHRQLKSFEREFFMFKEKQTAENQDFFHQKAIHIVEEGGKRMQYAVLSLLYKNHMFEDCLFVVSHFDIPASDWPSCLKFEKSEVDRAKKAFDLWKKKVDEEQEEIKDGFALLKKGQHMVNIVDSEAAVNLSLIPFVAESEFFGFDAEWNQSYIGEQGELCLIQLSSENRTLLIDIYTLKHKLNWSEEKFRELFHIIFENGKKIYGFGFISDLKVIAFNFPFFAKEIAPNLQNLVCVEEAVKKIIGDLELGEIFFGDDLPEKPNLASVASRLLNYDVTKGQQASVWNSRPIRFNQQKYAATDSYIVVKLRGLFYDKIEKHCPGRLDEVFFPYLILPPDDKENDELLLSKLDSDKSKSKSKQFTNLELIKLLKKIYTQLNLNEDSETPENISYIVDTMCGPLGAVLRRIGVNAVPATSDLNVIEIFQKQPKSRIITSGRACKKYSLLTSCIVNIHATLPLDQQVCLFFKAEKIYVNPNTINPRCVKCNEREMIYLPVLCLQYLQARMAFTKNIDLGLGVEVNEKLLGKLAKKMIKSNLNTDPDHYCYFSDGEWGLTGTFPNALIYFEHLCMRPLKKGLGNNDDTPLKLQLAMHLLDENYKYDENKLQTICANCGKENPVV